MSVLQGDDWLVVNSELVPLDGFTQVGLELQTTESARVHGIVEHFTTGFTSVLGTVHGDLRIPKHPLGLCACIAAERYANAAGNHDFAAIHLERRRESPPNTLGDPYGVTRIVQLLYKYQKLVTAWTSNRGLPECVPVGLALHGTRNGIDAAKASG